MVCERVYDGLERRPRQPRHLVEPPRQLEPRRVLVALVVVDVRQLHGQGIGGLQLGVELEDDVGAPPLRLRPFWTRAVSVCTWRGRAVACACRRWHNGTARTSPPFPRTA